MKTENFRIFEVLRFLGKELALQMLAERKSKISLQTFHSNTKHDTPTASENCTQKSIAKI